MECTSNIKHNKQRCRIGIQQKLRRGVQRKTIKSSKQYDTIYSIELKPKSELFLHIIFDEIEILKTDENIIQCCNDLMESCSPEIDKIKPHIIGMPCVGALLYILKYLDNHYSTYLHLEKGKTYHLVQVKEIELDAIYFINVQYMLSLCNGNEKLKEMFYCIIKLLYRKGIDNCFESDIEEMFYERVKEEYEWHTSNAGSKEEIREALSEIHNYRFGKYAQEKRLYKKANKYSKFEFIATNNSSEAKLFRWMEDAWKLINQNFLLLDFVYGPEENDDNAIMVDRFIRFNWSDRNEDGMNCIGSELEDDANNCGVGCFSFRNSITSTNKTIQENPVLREYLNLMNFENEN